MVAGSASTFMSQCGTIGGQASMDFGTGQVQCELFDIESDAAARDVCTSLSGRYAPDLCGEVVDEIQSVEHCQQLLIRFDLKNKCCGGVEFDCFKTAPPTQIQSPTPAPATTPESNVRTIPHFRRTGGRTTTTPDPLAVLTTSDTPSTLARQQVLRILDKPMDAEAHPSNSKSDDPTVPYFIYPIVGVAILILVVAIALVVHRRRQAHSGDHETATRKVVFGGDPVPRACSRSRHHPPPVLPAWENLRPHKSNAKDDMPPHIDDIAISDAQIAMPVEPQPTRVVSPKRPKATPEVITVVVKSESIPAKPVISRRHSEEALQHVQRLSQEFGPTTPFRASNADTRVSSGGALDLVPENADVVSSDDGTIETGKSQSWV